MKANMIAATRIICSMPTSISRRRWTSGSGREWSDPFAYGFIYFTSNKATTIVPV